VQLENRFTVDAPLEEAWKVLLDVERVARSMPGATLETVEGDEFTGKVKVKVGPIVVTYQGKARFIEIDEPDHRVVMEASGKEARGSGTAKATVTSQMAAAGGQTEVTVLTDLNITGRPAQFGRGVIADVSGKLIDKFAENLAAELATPSVEAAEESAGGVAADAPPTAAAAAVSRNGTEPNDTLDAMELVGPAARRLVPLLVALGVLTIVVFMRRRSRRHR